MGGRRDEAVGKVASLTEKNDSGNILPEYPF